MTSLLCTLLVSVLNPAESAQQSQDACALITVAEIAEAQSATVMETKSSTPDRKGHAAAQCFYVAEPFDRSVSLEVSRPDPRQPGSASPKEQWNRLFHPGSGGTDGKSTAKTAFGNSKKKNARPIEGLGDEAFWAGDGQVGAIYVLKGEVYFRLSVGGWTDESIRFEKSKELAEKVLKRM